MNIEPNDLNDYFVIANDIFETLPPNGIDVTDYLKFLFKTIHSFLELSQIWGERCY